MAKTESKSIKIQNATILKSEIQGFTTGQGVVDIQLKGDAKPLHIYCDTSEDSEDLKELRDMFE